METFSPLILINGSNLNELLKVIPTFIVAGLLISGLLYFIGYTVNFIYKLILK